MADGIFCVHLHIYYTGMPSSCCSLTHHTNRGSWKEPDKGGDIEIPLMGVTLEGSSKIHAPTIVFPSCLGMLSYTRKTEFVGQRDVVSVVWYPSLRVGVQTVYLFRRPALEIATSVVTTNLQR